MSDRDPAATIAWLVKIGALKPCGEWPIPSEDPGTPPTEFVPMYRVAADRDAERRIARIYLLAAVIGGSA